MNSHLSLQTSPFFISVSLPIPQFSNWWIRNLRFLNPRRRIPLPTLRNSSLYFTDRQNITRSTGISKWPPFLWPFHVLWTLFMWDILSLPFMTETQVFGLPRLTRFSLYRRFLSNYQFSKSDWNVELRTRTCVCVDTPVLGLRVSMLSLLVTSGSFFTVEPFSRLPCSVRDVEKFLNGDTSRLVRTKSKFRSFVNKSRMIHDPREYL